MDKNNFFYKNWWLFYLLFFLLLGILIYSLLWQNNNKKYQDQIATLNQQLEECINKPPPALENNTDIAPPNIVDCNSIVKSGGQGTTETEHDLGSKGGTVVLEYDALTIPDEFTIIYDGQIVASTNQLVSGYGTLTWNYMMDSSKPKYCTVKVSAPETNTKWSYKLNCPVQ